MTQGLGYIKAGTETAILEDTSRSVTFVTAFKTTPIIVVSFDDGSNEESICQINNTTTSGFDIDVLRISGGSPANRDVCWIAVSKGNN